MSKVIKSDVSNFYEEEKFTDSPVVQNMHYNNVVQQGWQCPVCHRILSPLVKECPCHGEAKYDVKFTNVSIPDNTF